MRTTIKLRIGILLIQMTLITSFYTSAQTNVSGFISANTTWFLSDSPFIVTGSIIVKTGVTLRIEAGSQIRFQTGKAIQIDGELIAIGNPGNRIVFTSDSSTHNGSWAKIQFTDSSADAVFSSEGSYEGGSILKFCDVLFGGSGNGAFQTTNASPYLNNCRILNSGSNGIYLSGSPVRIDSCSIKNCAGSGVFFNSLSNYDCNFIVTNDTIENNGEGGIFFNDGINIGCATNQIKGNYFRLNRQYGAIWVNEGINRVFISENVFEQNSSSLGGAIHINWGNRINIQCNIFIRNSANSGGAIYFLGGSNPNESYFTSNTFSKNQSSQGSAMYIDGCYVNYPSIIHVENNLIAENVSGGGEVLFIRGNMGTTNILCGFNVLNNFIVSNEGNITLQLSYFSGNIQNNTFKNPDCKYEIYNKNFTGQPNILVANNAWSTSDVEQIAASIYDFFDNPDRTTVEYLPMLPSSVITDTTCNPKYISLSVPEAELIRSAVFPNPFSTTTTVKCDHGLKNGKFVLYNIGGKKVRLIENIQGQTLKVTRDDLPSGIYFFNMTEYDKIVSKGKIIIVN